VPLLTLTVPTPPLPPDADGSVLRVARDAVAAAGEADADLEADGGADALGDARAELLTAADALADFDHEMDDVASALALFEMLTDCAPVAVCVAAPLTVPTLVADKVRDDEYEAEAVREPVRRSRTRELYKVVAAVAVQPPSFR
jgi:hypothetical protein